MAECMPTLHAGLRLLSEPATEEAAVREALARAIDAGRDEEARRLHDEYARRRECN